MIYVILFVLALCMLVEVVAKYHNSISIGYVLLAGSVVLVELGYMQSTSATELHSYVYANQIVYLGASFCPFFLLMCIADLSKYKIKKWVQILIIAYATMIMTLVSTYGYSYVYYKSIKRVEIEGVYQFTKEYGPAHIMYPIYIIGITLYSLWIVGSTHYRKNEVSHINSILLGLCMTCVSGLYIAEKALGLSVDVLPVAYVIALGTILFLLRRISMYEVKAISANSLEMNHEYGFLMCDGKGRYLGSDDTTKLWFPEVSTIEVDSIIKDESTDMLKQIGRWIRNEDDTEKIYLESHQRIIEVKHSVIPRRFGKGIHCVYYRDDTKQQQYTKLVKEYSDNLAKDVEAKTDKLRRIQEDIIISMASIVENRDNNTGGHIARTSDIIKIFVEYLRNNSYHPELSEKTAKRIIKAAPLHDFGKIAIPDAILNKPGKFTDEEYEKMKQHSAKGAVIVERILQNSEDVQFRKVAVNVAHYHHEKWDGRGYPEGISGKDIPFEARVMALADVFDALVSKRVYKESFGYDKAFKIIEESGGTHFDPQLCKEFLKCRPMLEELYNSYTD